MQTPDPPEIHRHLRSIDAVPNRSAGAGSAQGQPLAARVKGVARYRADPIRAGTTQRHLSFLERGRSAPGRGLVVRLAESLELPLGERNKLLVSVATCPPTRRRRSAIRLFPWQPEPPPQPSRLFTADPSRSAQIRASLMPAISKNIWIVMGLRPAVNGNCLGADRPPGQWLPKSMVRILTTPCGSPRAPSVADGLN